MTKYQTLKTKTCQECGWTIYLDHPETHDCNENPFYKAKQAVKAMGQGRREEILSLFKTGLTIGDTAKQSNVDSHQVSEIIMMNVVSMQHLRVKSI